MLASREVPALARVEARQFLRHPVFILAFIGSGLIMGVFGAFDRGVPEPVVDHITWGLDSLAGFTVVAACLIASRARRARAEELFASLPSRPRHSTIALLLAIGAPVAAAGALAASIALIVGLTGTPRPQVFAGPVMAESLMVLAQTLVMIGLFGAFGVAVARWFPYALAAGAAFLVSMQGFEAPLHPSALDMSGAVSSHAWHLAYGVALLVVMSAVAMARHGLTRLPLVAGVAGVTFAVLAGIAQ